MTAATATTQPLRIRNISCVCGSSTSWKCPESLSKTVSSWPNRIKLLWLVTTSDQNWRRRPGIITVMVVTPKISWCHSSWFPQLWVFQTRNTKTTKVASTLNPKHWSLDGTVAVTQLWAALQNSKSGAEWRHVTCWSITVFPPHYCYDYSAQTDELDDCAVGVWNSTKP